MLPRCIATNLDFSATKIAAPHLIPPSHLRQTTLLPYAMALQPYSTSSTAPPP
uniref:Uncharacterized protein n=1 Tax=Arundo donax TaxID=35708 RepID=A0A0A9CZT5_ARUDO